MATHSYKSVVWDEGMLLEPQHFQQTERHQQQLAKLPLQFHPYPWGFNQLQIDWDALNEGRLAIKVAQGLFPNGTAFFIEPTSITPRSIPLQINQSGLFYLSLKQQTLDLEYSNETIALLDDNHPETDSSDILVKSPALKIITEQHLTDDLIAMPFIAIKPIRTLDAIEVDTQFIPPMLTLHANHRLAHFLQEIQQLINKRCEALAKRLRDRQQTAYSEMQDTLLLQTLVRYQQSLHTLQDIKSAEPCQLYHTLASLSAELTSLISDERYQQEQNKYQHCHLAACFDVLLNTLREALKKALVQNAISIKLTPNALGLWQSELEDKLVNNHEFILTVSADEPLADLENTFPSQTKVASQLDIQNLVSRSLPGLELKALKNIPRQLPYYPEQAYFLVNKQTPLWASVQQSNTLFIQTSKAFTNLNIELWAIKGGTS